MTDHRSAITGEFVTAEHAQTNPDTTVSESRDHQTEPIVRTVGDLTARHQLARPNIRVAGREGMLKLVKPSEAYPGTVALIWGDWWEDVAPEEPCEVLP